MWEVYRTGDVVQRFFFRDVLAVLADHDGELAFVVTVRLAQLGNRNRLSRIRHRGTRLGEHGRVLRKIEARLENCMHAIVSLNPSHPRRIQPLIQTTSQSKHLLCVL